MGRVTDIPRATGHNTERAERYAWGPKEGKDHNGWRNPEGLLEEAGLQRWAGLAGWGEEEMR